MKVCLEDFAGSHVSKSFKPMSATRRFSAANKNGSAEMLNIKTKSIALLEINQMARFLKSDPSQLNTHAARFANIAFESVMLEAGIDAIEVIDASNLRTDDAKIAAVVKSDEVISNIRNKALSDIQQSEINVLIKIAKKNEAILRYVQETRAFITGVESKLQGLDSLPIDTMPTWQGCEKLFYVGEADYPKFDNANTVSRDLTQLIDSHCAILGSIYGFYNSVLLNNPSSLSEISFDPDRYITLSGFEESSGKAAYVGPELPGFKRLKIYCLHGNVSGIDYVLSALNSISIDIADNDFSVSSEQLNNCNESDFNIKKLSKEQIITRLNHMRIFIDRLEKSITQDFNMSSLNKAYEMIVMNTDSVEAAVKKQIGLSLLGLIFASISNVHEYAISVNDELIKYISQSIESNIKQE